MIENECVPNGHLILSYVKRNFAWPAVISELVDNAMDRAGGDASEIEIVIEKDSVTILDHGRGISDINRLATLGDSGSFGDPNGSVGIYGVGSKCWMCKALELSVETVVDGRLHTHAFRLDPSLEAIYGRSEKVPFPSRYRGAGKKARDGQQTYTKITMRRFHDWVKPLHVPSLVSELERNYWTALSAGRTIEITDRRKRPRVQHSAMPLAPPNWTDRNTFSGEIADKLYNCTIGILTDNIGSYSGLFIGFLYRTIRVEKRLPTRTLPPRVHAQITLGADWKDSLSNYKDDIVAHKEELLEDIERRAKDVLDLADSYAEDIRLEGVALEIEKKVNRQVRSGMGFSRLLVKKKNPRGDEDSVKTKKPTGEIEDGTKPSKERRERQNTQPSGTEIEPSSGLRFRWESLGSKDSAHVTRSGTEITVVLNRDCPTMFEMTKQPRYPGVYLAIGYELSLYCHENLTPSEMAELFGGLLDESATGSENKSAMCRSIVLFFAFLSEVAAKAA